MHGVVMRYCADYGTFKKGNDFGYDINCSMILSVLTAA